MNLVTQTYEGASLYRKKGALWGFFAISPRIGRSAKMGGSPRWGNGGQMVTLITILF